MVGCCVAAGAHITGPGRRRAARCRPVHRPCGRAMARCTRARAMHPPRAPAAARHSCVARRSTSGNEPTTRPMCGPLPPARRACPGMAVAAQRTRHDAPLRAPSRLPPPTWTQLRRCASGRQRDRIFLALVFFVLEFGCLDSTRQSGPG